jgi:hypothetical protein
LEHFLKKCSCFQSSKFSSPQARCESGNALRSRGAAARGLTWNSELGTPKQKQRLHYLWNCFSANRGVGAPNPSGIRKGRRSFILTGGASGASRTFSWVFWRENRIQGRSAELQAGDWETTHRSRNCVRSHAGPLSGTSQPLELHAERGASVRCGFGVGGYQGS